MLKKVVKIPIHSQYKELSISSPGDASADQLRSYQDGNMNVVNEENHFYEDILLIGKEKCVEDWPEDWPEANPDWKPPGKLRLRRTSLKNQETGVEDRNEDEKPKKGRKFKPPFGHRRSSKCLEEGSQKKSETLTDRREQGECQDGMQHKKGAKFKINFLSRRGSKDKYSDESSCRDLQTPHGISKSAAEPRCISTSVSSKVAEAEWLSAQRNLICSESSGAEVIQDYRNEDADGVDESQYTAEQWNRPPLEDEKALTDEEETKELALLADNIQSGIHDFNAIIIEYTEALWQDIGTLSAVADDIFVFNKKAKNSNITGGTLNSFKMAASLEHPVTMRMGKPSPTSASSLDSPNDSSERSKVECVIEDCRSKMADVDRCLCSVELELEKLLSLSEHRSSQTHHKDWEIRRALQIGAFGADGISRAVAVVGVVMEEIASTSRSVDSFYSLKDTRELKKSMKKEFASRIQELAQHLQERLMELNSIREELLDAIGYI